MLQKCMYCYFVLSLSILQNVLHVVKLKDYSGAVDQFEQTLDLAKVMGDETAENAIKSALNDVNRKIAQVCGDIH